MPDQRLHAHEADLARGLRSLARRQADEALELPGNRHQRVHGGLVVVAGEFQSDSKSPVRDEREGMRGIDCDWRQNREDVVDEVRLEPSRLCRRELFRLHDRDAVLLHFYAQCRPRRLLLAGQVSDEAIDLDELLLGRQPVLARGLHLCEDLAVQAGHAHHVELVQVRC